MLSSRRLEVLRAVVSQYVATSEPVSSKSVAQAKALGVSSATIRNDMGFLEQLGLIRQPHVSAGRVPTEAGYRAYVDFLPGPPPLTQKQERALEGVLRGVADLDDAVSKTVRYLSNLTSQTAVVEYPILSSTAVRRVELVDLEFSRLLVIVVTSTGEVSEKQVDTPGQETRDNLLKLRNALNESVADKPLAEAHSAAEQFTDSHSDQFGPLASVVGDTVAELTKPTESSRIVTAGAAHLARSGIEFSDVAQVLDALEDQVLLLRVLDEVHTEPIHVSIGRENIHESLSETSLVSATYSVPSKLRTHVGVIGPTRMNYLEALGAVEAVSRYLETLLIDTFGLKPRGLSTPNGPAQEASLGEDDEDEGGALTEFPQP